ncbi:hypothetical protein L195_g036383, partial [Trifolium pratense]
MRTRHWIMNEIHEIGFICAESDFGNETLMGGVPIAGVAPLSCGNGGGARMDGCVVTDGGPLTDGGLTPKKGRRDCVFVTSEGNE